MSSAVIYTCEGCGTQSKPDGLARWRRLDIEVYRLATGGKDSVANVELCGDCVRKHVAKIPDLHRPVL